MLLRIEFSSGRLLSERAIGLDLITCVSWFSVQRREHIERGVAG